MSTALASLSFSYVVHRQCFLLFGTIKPYIVPLFIKGAPLLARCGILLFVEVSMQIIVRFVFVIPNSIIASDRWQFAGCSCLEVTTLD